MNTNQSHSILSTTGRSDSSRTASICLLLFLLVLAPPARAGVLPNDAIVDGKTIGDWSGEWWKWVFGISTNQNPVIDPDGRFAQVGQPAGEVFFLAGAYGGTANTLTRTITISDTNYVFFPIINAQSGADPSDRGTIEERRDLTAALLSFVTRLFARIDGVDVPDLRAHQAPSPVFPIDFASPDNLTTLHAGTPVVGLFDDVVADGWYLMLEPLPPGRHTIDFGGQAEFGGAVVFQLDVRYVIDVVPTPLSERIEALGQRVAAANLPRKEVRPLLSILRGAAKSFERGHLRSGIHHLRAFQKKVRHEITRIDPALAEQFIAAAQRIIDRAEQDATTVHSQRRGDGTP